MQRQASARRQCRQRLCGPAGHGDLGRHTAGQHNRLQKCCSSGGRGIRWRVGSVRQRRLAAHGRPWCCSWWRMHGCCGGPWRLAGCCSSRWRMAGSLPLLMSHADGPSSVCCCGGAAACPEELRLPHCRASQYRQQYLRRPLCRWHASSSSSEHTRPGQQQQHGGMHACMQVLCNVWVQRQQVVGRHAARPLAVPARTNRSTGTATPGCPWGGVRRQAGPMAQGVADCLVAWACVHAPMRAWMTWMCMHKHAFVRSRHVHLRACVCVHVCAPKQTEAQGWGRDVCMHMRACVRARTQRRGGAGPTIHPHQHRRREAGRVLCTAIRPAGLKLTLQDWSLS